MTGDERRRIIGLIRLYRRELARREDKVDWFELRETLTNALHGGVAVTLCGQLYTATAGQLVVIDMSRVVDLGGD